MLSKNQIKFITSLKQKKYRTAHKLFVVEGVKGIKELLKSNLKLHTLYTTKSFNNSDVQEVLIDNKDLKRISFLTTPNTALAVFKMPEPQDIVYNKLILALDDVRDPGNLGTIIRLCDWFGITELICSMETVDCYNPKVVQATMGSITRVNITYTNLERFLGRINTPILGAFMDGTNVYKTTLPDVGVLVMGNEANGISKPIEKGLRL